MNNPISEYVPMKISNQCLRHDHDVFILHLISVYSSSSEDERGGHRARLK